MNSKEHLGKDHHLLANRRIFEIAAEMEPLFKQVESLYSQDKFEEWILEGGEYIQKLLSYADEIGELTNNATDNVKYVFDVKPSEAIISFTPDDIRNVARYESFSSDLWSRHSGRYREPTWTDDEILNGTTPEKFEIVRNERLENLKRVLGIKNPVDLARLEKTWKRKPK